MAKTSDRQLRQQLRKAEAAAVSKKAMETALLDVRELAGFTDYFLICHGTNPRQVEAIAEEIERVLGQSGVKPAHVEGLQNAEWVILDYISFVVHVFSQKSRQFYGLERIWQKAPRLRLRSSQSS